MTLTLTSRKRVPDPRKSLYVLRSRALPGRGAALSMRLYPWERPYLFSHAKLDKAFGASEVLPHREAIRDTVRWFRENPAPK